MTRPPLTDNHSERDLVGASGIRYKPESTASAAMRVQTDDPTFLAELLGFFRASGCIAYFDPELEALEVIAPHLFGPHEERQLQELLASWRLEHPEVDVRVSADVAA